MLHTVCVYIGAESALRAEALRSSSSACVQAGSVVGTRLQPRFHRWLESFRVVEPMSTTTNSHVVSAITPHDAALDTVHAGHPPANGRHVGQRGQAEEATGGVGGALSELAGHTRVFRDVVFQDVGVHNTIFKTPQPYQLQLLRVIKLFW